MRLYHAFPAASRLILSSLTLGVCASQALAQQTLEGRFAALVADYRDGRWEEKYVLVEHETGRPVPLSLTRGPAPGGRSWVSLVGRQVLVTGAFVVEAAPALESYLRADVVTPVSEGGPPQALIGPQPTLTILCAFPDIPSLAFSRSHYERVRGLVFPGVADFFATASSGRVSFLGSQVTDWVTLQYPFTHYYKGAQSKEVGTGFTSWYTRDLTLAQDCASAARAAGMAIPFDVFSGIDIQMNASLPVSYAYYGSVGGGTVGGFPPGGPLTRALRLAFHASWASKEVGTVAHEYGHTFGLPHAGSTYGNEYDSSWDTMSNARAGRDASSGFGYGTHFNAFGQASLQWITSIRQAIPPAFVLTEHTLAPLGMPSLPGLLLITIPTTSAFYYTVEARRRTLPYEQAIPSNGVIVHRISQGRSFLIDSDNNGNPNDAGAVWTPGERFTDPVARIVVEVLEEANGTYRVRIGRDPPLTISSAGARPAAIEGFAYLDQLVCLGCTGGEQWTVTAGSLPTGLSVSTGGGVQGTPGMPGVYQATMRVVEGSSSASAEFTWTVVDGVAIISDSIRPPATSGTAYVDTLRATSPRGPVSWEVVGGELPSGLLLDRNAGQVSGIPGISATPIRVWIAAGAGAARRLRAFVYEVRRPVLGLSAVRDYYLGGRTASLAPNEQLYLDLLGNKNGSVDIGDIRAWLIDTGRLRAGATLQDATQPVRRLTEGDNKGSTSREGKIP